MWRATEIGGWQCDKCGDVIILFAEKDGNYCPKCGAYHGCEIATQKWKVKLCSRTVPQTYTTDYVEARTKDEITQMYCHKEMFVSDASAVVSWVDYKGGISHDRESN